MGADDYELIGLSGAEPTQGAQVGNILLRTHGPAQCVGEYCCIHNPSDHPLRDAPMNWRGDRGLMERLCQHGVGHPDPDDLTHKQRVFMQRYDESYRERYEARAFAIHGCDGCCRPLPCLCNEGVQPCVVHPGRLRSQGEKIKFRKDWDRRVGEDR